MKENQPVLGGNMFGDWGDDKPRKKKKSKNVRSVFDVKPIRVPTLASRSIKYPTLNMPSLYGNEQKEPERDSRRAFSTTQKHEILYQQNGKCAICRKQLDFRAVDYDHKKPWADGGRTITINGRALCKDCHGIETHKTRLKKVEKKPKKQDNFGLYGRGLF